MTKLFELDSIEKIKMTVFCLDRVDNCLELKELVPSFHLLYQYFSKFHIALGRLLFEYALPDNSNETYLHSKRFQFISTEMIANAFAQLYLTSSNKIRKETSIKCYSTEKLRLELKDITLLVVILSSSNQSIKRR